ncbi:LuxR C-terminal-related transcriptional regulator [Actinoplanes sp. CA-030573]|uniref:LuxR C-terminal-related transcriptional regulator n=1 Tax=Actinoplanes sp. CA-030573 TaxID=3239898 RepID=UPI003D8D1EAC
MPGASPGTSRPGSGRLGRPAVRHPLVPRPRLAEMLDAGVRRAVTLVCAGPGWGKSTLVSWWAESRAASGPIGWLTLGPPHNDPRTFWSDFVLALRMAGALPYGNPLEHLDGGDQPTVRQVIAGLDELTAPVVLVLDDFHEVHDPKVVGGLAELLHDPPPALRLVLVGRTEPSLPLHRFRAAGDLTEIRARHLAFRAPEAAELPVVLRQRLPVEELTGLVGRTEGWVVGLQLLGDTLAERGTVDNGEVRAVTDYLLREVVAGLPPKMRQFLVRTSVAAEVNGPLADALTGESHSRRLLERLETANAFVTRDEHRPGWFRYHPLLRDALRHELDLDRPGAEPELNLLAAQWYAGEQLTMDALRHAIAARDWRYAGRLAVERAMVRVLTSEREPFVEVIAGIPADQYAASPELALCGVAVRYSAGDRSGVASMLRLARTLAPDRSRVPPATDMTLRLMEAAILHWRRGAMAELIAMSSDTLKRLTAFRLDELPSLLHYRALALDQKGAGLLWMDRADHADRYLWAASTAARSVGASVLEISALAHLGLLVYLQGSVREAADLVNTALDVARRDNFATMAQGSLAYLALALIELERDRITEAQECLRKGLHAGGDEPAAIPSVLATLVRARILLATGEPAACRALLRQARDEMPPGLSSPLLDRWLRLTLSETDLATGFNRDVVARYESPAPRGILTPAEQVTLARAYLGLGEHAAAERLLARVRGGADHVAATVAWLATAFAAEAEGHGNRSIDALSQAVAVSEREGIRRPFRMVDQRRLAVLLDRRRWVEERTMPPSENTVEGADALSERERDVLRYLPTVLTAGEIAANLNISVNTVKAHMRSIYRKLGAARRREAVVRARQLGLL